MTRCRYRRDAWPSATFRLRAGNNRFRLRAGNNRLRFCGVVVPPEAAGTIQTADVGARGGGNQSGAMLSSASLTPVTDVGVAIDPSAYLGTGNEPGVLAFEAAQEVWEGSSPELLVDVNGETLFRFKLPMSIHSVDYMYRWRGLRNVCGGSVTIPDRTGEPSNLPDTEMDCGDLFFVHGFNVSEAAARNWSRQVFKRLWLSGSRARFHGVAWYGDYNLAGSAFNGLHYHQDVYHALKTASAFKAYVEGAQPRSAKRVLMAHSLGNMMASEALRQGLAVGKYFMFNAAVASEAYDGTLQAAVETDDGYMKYVPSDWYGYTNLCWAANWYRWFVDDAIDARGRMGWPDYFAGALANAGVVYNYYSSGDEVFEEMPTTPSLLSGVFHWPTFQASWPFVDLSSVVTPSVNAWQKQEVLKGVDNVAGTLAGGWGFHYVSNSTPSMTTWRIYTPEEANDMVENGTVVTNAVFARTVSAMFNPTATQDAQFETLAKYVPAVSSATGKRSIFVAYGRDINMNLDSEQGVVRTNGWGRNHPQYESSWLHSDMKNMAYWYVFQLYKRLSEVLR